MNRGSSRAGPARRLGGILGLASLVLACAPSPDPPGAPPNIVLIVVDTLRADAVELAGSPPELTPTIRKLAGESVWFSNAFTHTTWTKPSVATLLTSLFPTQHGIRTSPEISEKNRVYYSRILVDDVETVAECLRDAGYRTGGIVMQPYLGPTHGFSQGFDEYVAARKRDGRRISGHLREWIERQPPSAGAGPFFLYLHYLDPHWPYSERVDELRKKIGPLTIEPELPRSANALKRVVAANGLTDAQARGLRARYDHGAAATDRELGQALSMLDGAGMLENTAILVTSDHGEGFYEHRKVFHAYAPYEEVIRVPLLLHLPERFAVRPARSEALVGLVDVKPTILDIAGVESHAVAMGRSLLPLARRPDAELDRPIFGETGGILSLRTRRHKLIRRPDGRVEFYDLLSDPLERSALPCDETCRDLSRQLDSLVALLRPFDDDSGPGIELSSGEVEQLRSLGYLD